MPPLSVYVDPISYLLCYFCSSLRDAGFFDHVGLLDGVIAVCDVPGAGIILPHTITDVTESVAEIPSKVILAVPVTFFRSANVCRCRRCLTHLQKHCVKPLTVNWF